MHNGKDTEPPTPSKWPCPAKAPDATGKCTESCDIAGHAHEDGLRCKLKRPESDFLESSLAGLFIHDVPGKSIVGLQLLLAGALVIGSQGFIQQPRGHP